MTANANTNSSSNTQKTIKSYPLPTRGSFVLCKFPHEEPAEQQATLPPPKKRPALVVGVEPVSKTVNVVYGTTQNVGDSEIYPSELVIRKTDQDFSYTGLSHDTKFKLERTVQLPYNSEYFEIPAARYGKPVPVDPKIGILPFSYVDALQMAAKNIKK